MLKKVVVFLSLLVLTLTLGSCSSVEPNYEGVLMENYGRNGESDFRPVKGRQWTFAPGKKLYQVPMFETSGDPDKIDIYAKDGGKFTVDPSYQYKPMIGTGVKIVFSYKHLGVDEPEVMFDQLEASILNKLVVNAYRELARKYTTDSLMNNLNDYEVSVEQKLQNDFNLKYMHLENLTSGLTPPKSMADAIEARNNAVQKANQIENEVRVAKMEQEKAIIEKETNEIKSKGLTKEILTEKYINAIRYSSNRIIITDGKTPVILQ
jgi:regulator of protease activity HflC (stomatin/prohibitin superfamily)